MWNNLHAKIGKIVDRPVGSRYEQRILNSRLECSAVRTNPILLHQIVVLILYTHNPTEFDGKSLLSEVSPFQCQSEDLSRQNLVGS